MNKSIIFILILSIFCLTGLFSQTILSTDASAIKAQELFLLNGELLPVFSWPVSAEYVCVELARLAERAPWLADDINELIQSMMPSRDIIARYNIKSSIQLRIGGISEISQDGEDRFFDIKRGLLDVPQFTNLAFFAGKALGLGVGASLNLRREWMLDYSVNTNLPAIGLEGNPIAFDNHMTEYADLFYNAPDWSFYFGRSTVHWGQLDHSSIYVADSIPYLDRAGVNLRLGLFRFDWFMASIQNVKSATGVDVVPDAGFGFESDPIPSTTWVSAKRFSFQTKNICLGIGEMLLYSRRDNYLLLTDFLPVIDWHSTDVRPNNMVVYLDFSWVPFKGIKVFTMVGFDDISGDVFGITDGEIPTIPAYLGGVDAIFMIDQNMLVTARTEVGWTHYLWGNFDAQRSSLADYSGSFARAIFRYISDEGAILIPLTSPYGPGAFWVSISGEISIKTIGLKLGMDCLVLYKYSDVDLVRTGYYSQSEYSAFPPFYYAKMEINGSYVNKLIKMNISPGLEVGRTGASLFLGLYLTVFYSGNKEL